MKQIDCRGLNCPEPVLKAKAALEQQDGEPFAILVDNEASRDNVLRFGQSRHCRVQSAKLADDAFQLIFAAADNKTANSATFDEADYRCEPVSQLPTAGQLVYVIASDCMGRGSDDLGWALMQTYITTIQEITPPPSRILFYNGGVKLAATAGKALEALQALEKKGVRILSCGTCLEFFKLEKKLQVGTITNMYEILDSMASADKVVGPF